VIEFVKVLHDQACRADVTVAEAETFIYARAPMCFRRRRASSASKRPYRWLPFLPPARAWCSTLFMKPTPSYRWGNVLQTGLNNMGAIFHPALTLLNAGLD